MFDGCPVCTTLVGTILAWVVAKITGFWRRRKCLGGCGHDEVKCLTEGTPEPRRELT